MPFFRPTRRLNVEPLESREMLSVSPTDFSAIREQYPLLNLSENMDDYNVISLAAGLDSAQALADALFAASESEKPDVIIALTDEESEIKLIEELVINWNTETYGAVYIAAFGTKTLTIKAAEDSRILTVGEESTVFLAGITLTGGNATQTTQRAEDVGTPQSPDGGAILTSGSLYILDSVITENTAANGGAIAFDGGILHIANSTICLNTATEENGGAIFSRSIEDAGSEIIIVHTTIAENAASHAGGGIYVDGADVTIINTIISKNTSNSADFEEDEIENAAGSGVYHVSGELTFVNSIVGGNEILNADEDTPFSADVFTDYFFNQTQSIFGTDPLLDEAAIDDNGRIYYPISLGSIAIDNGSVFSDSIVDAAGKLDIGSFQCQDAYEKAPLAPDDFIVQAVGATEAYLAWAASENATYYIIFRSYYFEDEYEAIASTNSLSYLDTNLSSCMGYTYIVQAVNSFNENAEDAEDDEDSLTEAITITTLLDVPQWSSYENSANTIYLDFDGHAHINTTWNSSAANGLDFINSAFSLDDNYYEFSEEELAFMLNVFNYVSVLYSPFNVNVTTVLPCVFNDTVIRVTIGDYGDYTGIFDAAGIAPMNAFKWNADVPVLVFTTQDMTYTEAHISETIAHEAGHAFGLDHHGEGEKEYSSGYNGWAPIMGASYTANLQQWSNGDYPGATNPEQDDLKILSDLFGYREDVDYELILSNNTISGGGIIEQTDDSDKLSFTLDAISNVFLTIYSGATINGMQHSSLYFSAHIVDEQGVIVVNVEDAFYDPTSEDADHLTLTLFAILESGTYSVIVTGIGWTPESESPDERGFSSYGSVGSYQIEGFFTRIEPKIAAEQNAKKDVIISFEANEKWQSAIMLVAFDNGQNSFLIRPNESGVSISDGEIVITEDALQAAGLPLNGTYEITVFADGFYLAVAENVKISTECVITSDYDKTSKEWAITFNTEIFENAENLKSQIFLSTDNGESYNTLAAGDIVTVSEKTVTISFVNGLSRAENIVRINADALKDSAGNLIPLYVSNAIDARSKLTGTLSIDGTLKFGQLLSAIFAASNNTGTLSYQWQRDGVNIDGATSTAYRLTADDIGDKTITCIVTSSVETGELSAESSGIIEKADAPDAPCFEIDYVNETTTAVVPKTLEYNIQRTMDEGAPQSPVWTDGTGKPLALQADTTYEFRVKETDTTIAGAVQTLEAVARQAAPEIGVLTVTKPDNGAAVGKTTVDLTTVYEYRIKRAGDEGTPQSPEWVGGSEAEAFTTNVRDLVVGDKIEVRLKATPTAFASESFEYTITADDIGEMSTVQDEALAAINTAATLAAGLVPDVSAWDALTANDFTEAGILGVTADVKAAMLPHFVTAFTITELKAITDDYLVASTANLEATYANYAAAKAALFALALNGTYVSNNVLWDNMTATITPNYGSDVDFAFTAITEIVNADNLAADKGIIGAGVYEIPFANQSTQTVRTAWMQAAVNEKIVNGSKAVVAWDSANQKYVVTLTNGSASDSVLLTATLAADVTQPSSFTLNVPVDESTEELSSVAISWTASTNAHKYDIYRNGIKIGSTAENTYTDDTVVQGTEYTFHIIAVNNTSNKTAISSSVTLTTNVVRQLEAPTVLAAAISADCVLLTWNKVNGATGYTVTWAEKPQSGRAAFSAEAAETLNLSNTHCLLDLPANKEYEFTVIAEYADNTDFNAPPATNTVEMPTESEDKYEIEITLAYKNNAGNDLTWVDEWSNFWVEVSVDHDSNISSIVNCVLNYNPKLFQVDKVECGSGISGDVIFSDDKLGNLTLTGAATFESLTSIFRIHFVPVQKSTVDKGLSDKDLGIGVNVTAEGYAESVEARFNVDASIMSVVAESEIRKVENNATSQAELLIYPVIYDLDDSGKIDTKDFSLFIKKYGKDVADGTKPFDFNPDNKINTKDFSAFIKAYGKSRTEAGKSKSDTYIGYTEGMKAIFEPILDEIITSSAYQTL